MAISNVGSNYTVYDNLYSYNQTKTGETDKMSETKTETAKKSTSEYLSELNKKYSGLNIMGGSINRNYRSGRTSGSFRHDVTIHPSILKKMMSDPEEAAKYEKKIAGIQKYEGWAISMVKAATGCDTYYMASWIDENGNVSHFGVSGPSEKQIKADKKRKEEEQEAFEKRLEKAREKSKEKRKELEELLKGDKEGLPNTDTSADIDTSDLMKIVSLDIKI